MSENDLMSRIDAVLDDDEPWMTGPMAGLIPCGGLPMAPSCLRMTALTPHWKAGGIGILARKSTRFPPNR